MRSVPRDVDPRVFSDEPRRCIGVLLPDTDAIAEKRDCVGHEAGIGRASKRYILGEGSNPSSNAVPRRRSGTIARFVQTFGVFGSHYSDGSSSGRAGSKQIRVVLGESGDVISPRRHGRLGISLGECGCDLLLRSGSRSGCSKRSALVRLSRIARGYGFANAAPTDDGCDDGGYEQTCIHDDARKFHGGTLSGAQS